MRDWLLVFGLLVLLVGLVLGVPNALFACTNSASQSQFDGEPVCANSHAWALTGVAVAGVGVIAVAMGWFIPTTGPPPPVVQQGRYLACKGCGRIYLEGAATFCPAGGMKLGTT